MRIYHGRGDWIRTSDTVVPNHVRYQAALHPVIVHENTIKNTLGYQYLKTGNRNYREGDIQGAGICTMND